jgi:hypothetical protein
MMVFLPELRSRPEFYGQGQMLLIGILTSVFSTWHGAGTAMSAGNVDFIASLPVGRFQLWVQPKLLFLVCIAALGILVAVVPTRPLQLRADEYRWNPRMEEEWRRLQQVQPGVVYRVHKEEGSAIRSLDFPDSRLWRWWNFWFLGIFFLLISVLQASRGLNSRMHRWVVAPGVILLAVWLNWSGWSDGVFVWHRTFLYFAKHMLLCWGFLGTAVATAFGIEWFASRRSAVL